MHLTRTFPVTVCEFDITDCCRRFVGEFSYRVKPDAPERVCVDLVNATVKGASVQLGTVWHPVEEIYQDSLSHYVWTHCSEQLEAIGLKHHLVGGE
jgi:hypothetical protein